jgi:hypothetical protein
MRSRDRNGDGEPEGAADDADPADDVEEDDDEPGDDALADGELTVDEARRALERHVSRSFWLQHGLAATLPVSSFERTGAFHVELECFTESRTRHEEDEPYHGGSVDGPERGAAPKTWELGVERPDDFVDDAIRVEVPHTSVVERCPSCRGRGVVPCGSCGGDGKVTRTERVSAGSGQRHHHHTRTTKVTCSVCRGSGEVGCETCEGTGDVRRFEVVEVVWKNVISERVIEKTDLPDELLPDVEGVEVLCEEEKRLEPGTGGGGGGGPFRGGLERVNAEVDAAVNELLEEAAFGKGTKLRRQRVTVRAVPVWEARYAWGRDERRFWVFGTDLQVHAPRFPVSASKVAAAIILGVLAGLALLAWAAWQRAGTP